MFIDRVFRDPR